MVKDKPSRFISIKETLKRIGMLDDLSNLIIKLAGKDISNSNLSNKNLTGANYEGCILGGSFFYNSLLLNSSFRGSIFENCDLDGAMLEGADLRVDSMTKIKFNRAHLERVNLENTNISSVEMRDCVFDGSNLFNVVITSCIMGKTSFIGADLRAAIINNVYLDENIEIGTIIFKDADLTGASIDLGKAVKIDVILTGAKLASSRLADFRVIDQELKNTDFSKCTIIGSFIEKVTFIDCKFGRTSMRHVRFSSCTFNNIVFNHSTFMDVIWKNCTFNDCSFRVIGSSERVSFSTVEMTNCNFYKFRNGMEKPYIFFEGEKSSLVRCDFMDVNLSLINDPHPLRLEECNFARMKLVLNLEKATIKNCTFQDIHPLEGGKIEQSKIKDCTFLAVDFRDIEIKSNTIRNTIFEGGHFRFALKSNNITTTSFTNLSFNNSWIEDNKLEKVTFERVEIKGGTFLNNGDEGYSFIDSSVSHTQIDKHIPGISYSSKVIIE